MRIVLDTDVLLSVLLFPSDQANGNAFLKNTGWSLQLLS
ncbi:MAG: PIN domain-containing protein [Oscillibacter sp.]|nr:PIN domain-containing protein [Oscillibacter sp.]